MSNLLIFSCYNATKVAVGSFGCFILLNRDEPLSAERAFVSLSLFNTLRIPLFLLPLTISNLNQVFF